MTREKEDQLLAELSKIRLERRKLIRRIVQARALGDRDEEAISALETLSERQLELTEPDPELISPFAFLPQADPLIAASADS